MSPRCLLLLAAAAILNAAPAGLTGAWKLVYAGDPRTGPKTVGSIILDLQVDGDVVTGRVHIGVWPGEAPIADGRIQGGHVTFTGTGKLSSTTGIPTCRFDVTVHEDKMRLTMTAIRNPGGPLAPGHTYEYVGGRTPQYR